MKEEMEFEEMLRQVLEERTSVVERAGLERRVMARLEGSGGCAAGAAAEGWRGLQWAMGGMVLVLVLVVVLGWWRERPQPAAAVVVAREVSEGRGTEMERVEETTRGEMAESGQGRRVREAGRRPRAIGVGRRDAVGARERDRLEVPALLMESLVVQRLEVN